MSPEITTELYRRIATIERQVSTLNRRGKASGWQLNSMFDMHRYGGGKLLWAFDGQSRNQYGEAINWNEQGGLTMSNYRTATYGGPNVTFDGAGEYLTNSDGPWQESLAEEFLVWGWCYPTNIANNRVVAAKYIWSANFRSWYLRYDLAATDFTFLCNATGAAAGNVVVTSTYGAVVVDQWYFVAGYFEPSTLMRVYVGMNTGAALTIDSLAVGVPASLFNAVGDPPLTIGADGNPSTYFTGNIGKVLGRANVPSAVIDDHVNMLFLSSREFYAE